MNEQLRELLDAVRQTAAQASGAAADAASTDAPKPRNRAISVLESSADKHAMRPHLELIKVVAGIGAGEVPLLAKVQAVANRLGVIARIAPSITALFFGAYEQRPREPKGSQTILRIKRAFARQTSQLRVRNSSLFIEEGEDAGNIRLVGLPRGKL